MSQGPHKIIFNPVSGLPLCEYCGAVPPSTGFTTLCPVNIVQQPEGSTVAEWTPEKSPIRIFGDGDCPHSTAIIVGPRCVIGCAHSLRLFDDPDKRKTKQSRDKSVGDDYWIATSLSRDRSGALQPKDWIPLDLYKFHQLNDWAIFVRTDDKQFAPEEIASIGDVSDLSCIDAKAQVIHCPAAFSTPDSIRPYESIGVWRSRIFIQAQSVNHFRYDGSQLSRGSSGGAVFVYPSMKVIAMHQELFTEAQYDDDEPVYKMTSQKRTDSETNVEEEYDCSHVAKKQKTSVDSETIKSLSGGNSGQGSAIILSSCDRLLFYLEDINSQP